MAEQWGRVQSILDNGTIPKPLATASTLYSSALAIQRVFGSAGVRSQTNYPESFSQWSAGGLQANQPSWQTVYNNKMKIAKETLEKYIKFLVGEEQTETGGDLNGMASVSNRDFESHWDKAFGFGVGEFDFF